MATVCGKIFKGQDLSCGVTQKGYAQEVVLVNHSDIESKNIDVDCNETTSKYRAAPVLKEGTTGVLFTGPIAGNVLRVLTNKTRDDNGFPEYEHGLDMLMAGVTEDQKCILSGLDKGLVVAFAKMKIYDETVGDIIPAIEIVGLDNGMTTGDYTYDITENGGAVPIELRSLENSLEANLPYIYASTVPGSEILDFDNLFANTGA